MNLTALLNWVLGQGQVRPERLDLGLGSRLPLGAVLSQALGSSSEHLNQIRLDCFWAQVSYHCAWVMVHNTLQELPTTVPWPATWTIPNLWFLSFSSLLDLGFMRMIWQSAMSMASTAAVGTMAALTSSSSGSMCTTTRPEAVATSHVQCSWISSPAPLTPLDLGCLARSSG